MPEKSTVPKGTKPERKVANGLVTLSSAAVLAIYAAGYQRTRSAAEQFDAAAAERRPVVPAPAPAARPAEEMSTRPVVPTPPAVASIEHPAATRPAALPTAPVATRPAIELAAPVAVSPTPDAIEPAPVAANPTTSETPVEAPKSLSGTTPAEAIPTLATATAAPAAATLVQYKDGTYHAWGRSRHGDIYTFVVIEKGRIVHSGYDKCQTRWPCDLVDHLGPQVVKRQSAEVDYVSGATDSANAFYWGIVEALAKAKVDAPPETTADSQSAVK